MKIKMLLVAFLFPAAYSFSQSIAPFVINSSGGFTPKNTYQVEWSIGELALVNQMDALSGNLIATNGFLQPYLLYPANISFASTFEAGEVIIFPNPAPTFVEVNFLTRQKGRVNLSLYDALGKIVYTQEVNCYGVDLIHRIPVNHFPAGTYMLRIMLKSFSGPISNGYVSKSGIYKIVTAR